MSKSDNPANKWQRQRDKQRAIGREQNPIHCPECGEKLDYEPGPENDGFCSERCLADWYEEK